MRFRSLLILPPLLALSMGSGWAKYKVKDIQLKAANEYASHQDFQGVVIGAYPCTTQAKVQELFDTDKLHERGFLPVLLVLENNNEFPVQIAEQQIFLVDPEGVRTTPIEYQQVLLQISTKKPGPILPEKRDLTKRIDKNMRIDFEHKAFLNKLVAPLSSDHGVVFFRLPDKGSLDGYLLYLPEVVDFSSGQGLMFFEFELIEDQP